MTTKYDAIVIGAGSVGVPITYFLSEKGYKVLCLEKRHSSGQGQNKSAIGGVRATHSDPAKIKICQKSLEIFTNWEKNHGMSVGWKSGGYCFPVFDNRVEGILKGILPIQKKFDLNIDWVEPDMVKEIVPGINPHDLRGGTYSPDDGQVSPLKAIEAISITQSPDTPTAQGRIDRALAFIRGLPSPSSDMAHVVRILTADVDSGC